MSLTILQLRRKLEYFWRTGDWEPRSNVCKKNKNGFADYPDIPRTGSREPVRTPWILSLELLLQYFAFLAPLPDYGYAIVNCI